MKNRRQTETSKTGESRVYNASWTKITELSDAELQAVAGGINPQPLPPRAESRLS